MSATVHFRQFPRGAAGAGAFTLLEVIVAVALSTVVFGAALASIVFLQKSYAATEQYAADLADQSRLMDSLAMDLRRARDMTALTTDGDGNTTSITLALPDYYDLSTGDAAPFPPSVYLNPEPRVAFYGDPLYYNDPLHQATVTYSLTKPAGSGVGPVTRRELRRDGSVASFANVADRVVRFQVAFDDARGADAAFSSAVQARISATLQPVFQTPALPDPNTAARPLLNLHGMAFLRNNNARLR